MAGRRTAPATIPVVTAPDSRRWLGPALTAASLVLLALVILLVPDVRQAAREAISGNTDDLKELLNGVDAAAILLVLMLMHAVVWYPAEIIMVTAGFAYGFWLALPLMMVGWTLSAMLSYEIGAHVAGPVIGRLAGQERFDRLKGIVERGGAPALLAARLIPVVPFSLTGYVAGAARVPRWRFVWTTVVGYAPLCIIVTLLGSRFEDFSFEDPVVYLALVGLAVLFGGAVVLGRRFARA
jgi:uncharacterized membrane protein YdjX (TVP38/TMEM64 family)